MNYRIKSVTGVVALITLLFGACKKGENDPFLSLKTRKARISGEWKLSSGEMKSTSTDNLGTQTSTTTYDGTNSTEDGKSSPYSLTLTINKDGTYKWEEKDAGSTFLTTGTWDFNTGVGDDKKKERIILKMLEVTDNGTLLYSQSGTEAGILDFYIDELRNKKLVLLLNGDYESKTGPYKDITEGSWTFEQ